jgi:hypothetical protein
VKQGTLLLVVLSLGMTVLLAVACLFDLGYYQEYVLVSIGVIVTF